LDHTVDRRAANKALIASLTPEELAAAQKRALLAQYGYVEDDAPPVRDGNGPPVGETARKREEEKAASERRAMIDKALREDSMKKSKRKKLREREGHGESLRAFPRSDTLCRTDKSLSLQIYGRPTSIAQRSTPRRTCRERPPDSKLRRRRIVTRRRWRSRGGSHSGQLVLLKLPVDKITRTTERIKRKPNWKSRRRLRRENDGHSIEGWRMVCAYGSTGTHL
jgi:hypothetical protein